VKIAAWNVNSLKVRLPHRQAFLEAVLIMKTGRGFPSRPADRLQNHDLVIAAGSQQTLFCSLNMIEVIGR
jgi:hypothetical protein